MVVVVGACGIAAGTPLAVLAAIARTARSGAFVKDGAHLEMLSSVDTVVFDKTGTITTGTPTVVGVHVEEGRSLPELLGYAASAESWSEHPLGQAILTRARDEGIPMAHPEDFDYAPPGAALPRWSVATGSPQGIDSSFPAPRMPLASRNRRQRFT